jgi:hypothetical protein
MHSRRLTCWLCCAAFLLAGSPLRADTSADPLRLVPALAEIVFKLENPKRITESIYYLDAVQDVLKIDLVRELYDSTNARRAYQLLAYFEKQLGRERFELLDQLAGGGMVIAGKFTSPPAALAVFQAKDKGLLKKFVAMGLDVIDEELARQEAKERPKKTRYQGIETIQLDKVHAAVAGSALLLANDAKVLQAAIDCHLGKAKSIADSKSLAEARKTLSARSQAADLAGWLWLDLKAIHTIPGYREGVKTLTLQPVFYFVVGPLFDLVERSSFLAVGLYQHGKDFEISARMPSGRKGLPAKADLFLPGPKDGILPLLKPSNTLASFSYYLDLGKIWKHKDQWLSKDEAKQLEEGEKKIAPFLAGIRIGKLLEQAGAHHRVIVSQPDQQYVKPNQLAVNASALVIDMRDPQFGKSMESILRAAGLIGSFQVSLKMAEEKRGPYKIVSYRFAEKQKLAPEVARVLVSYSPSFVTVGNQFIVSSTVELARELVDMVAKEEPKPVSAVTSSFEVYSGGVAASFRAGESQLRTQFVLGQALSPSEADRQIRELISIIERLGVLEFATRYGQTDFSYDVRLKMK